MVLPTNTEVWTPAPTVLPPAYRRREPQKSLLYDLVATEAPGLRKALAQGDDQGGGLARHVGKELTAFLDCGRLDRGFARVYCRRCRAEHLVAFSCKNRAICPSCTARRMDDCAAHLVDRLLPHARYRQWVVTFPHRVRYLLAAKPQLASLVLGEVLRVLFAWQRRAARRLGHRTGRANANGAVTFLQRFNSALQLAIHFHILVPDAVFVRQSDDPDQRPRIVEIPPPTDDDVAALLDRIIARVTALLTKLGHLEDTDETPDPQLVLAMHPAARPRGERTDEELPPLCARKAGFSLHAATAIHSNDRAGLERLARYGLRPPLAQGRLRRDEDGTVVYQMKRVFSDGTAVQRFTPRAFVQRLCALVPPPRRHMVRYAGIFAPNARGRYALTGRGLHHRPAAPPPTSTTKEPPAPPPNRPHDHAPDDPTRARRLDWANLMRRSHGLDVLACPRCGDRMELIATLEDPHVVRKILDHLGLTPRPPPRPPPRHGPMTRSLFADHSLDPPSLFH